MPIADIGCASGCAPNTNDRELAPEPIPTSIFTRRSGWSIGTDNAQPPVGESMNGPWSESRDAGNPHVRFDERDLETERINRHRARSRLYHALRIDLPV